MNLFFRELMGEAFNIAFNKSSKKEEISKKLWLTEDELKQQLLLKLDEEIFLISKLINKFYLKN